MKYTDNQKLVNEYKKLLIDSGLSQTDIAAKTGQSRQAFSAWIRHGLTFEKVARLADMVGYELHFSFIPKSSDTDDK